MITGRPIGWKRGLEGILILSSVFFFSFLLLRSYPVHHQISEQSQYVIHQEDRKNNIDVVYGFDLPLFYFSILPRYLPTNIYKVREERQLFYKAAREFQPSQTLVHVWNLLPSVYAEDSVLYVRNALAEGNKDIVLSSCSPELNELSTSLSVNMLGGKVVWPRIAFYGRENQFHKWLVSTFSLDATSIYDGLPLWNKIIRALSWTIAVQLPPFIFVLLIGILIGIQFHQRHTVFNKFLQIVLYSMYALPMFALCTFLIFLAAWLLPHGWWSISIGTTASASVTLWSILQHYGSVLFIPWIAIFLHHSIYVARHTESTITREFRKRYVLSAISRGLSELEVLRKHILPNSKAPLIMIVISMLPALFSGSIIVEVIFNIPGVGRLFWDSILQGDWSVTLALITISALVTFVAYWLGDFIYYKMNREI